MDNQGRAVHSWKSQYEPGQSVYLLENGHLLHCCFTKNRGFTRGGEGGRLEEFDWDGNLVWEFEYSTDQYLSHHDVKPLPNGNTLICAGVRGTFFEVTRDGETVWEYVNPVVSNGILAQGEQSGLDHRGHNWNAVFKIHRYPVDYPGLIGKDLTPIGPIEQPASMAGKTGFSDQPPRGAPVGSEARSGDRRPAGGQRGVEERQRGPGREEGQRGPGGAGQRGGENRRRGQGRQGGQRGGAGGRGPGGVQPREPGGDRG